MISRFIRPLLLNVMGVFFLLAASGKLLDMPAFDQSLAQYGAFPGWLPPLLVGLELAIGFALILQVFLRPALLTALALLAVLTLSFAYGHWMLGVEDCGCFGAIDGLRTPPWMSFTRNGIALAALVFLLHPDRSAAAPPIRWRWNGALWSLVLTSSIIFLPMLLPERTISHDFIQLPVQALDIEGLGPFDPDSTYIVFVFHPKCSHCRAATPKLLAWQQEGRVDQIYGLTLEGLDTELADYRQSLSADFPVFTGDPAQLARLAEDLPTLFFIRENTIEHVLVGSIP